MVKEKHDVDGLEKCPTGIRGLDEITKGGLPKDVPPWCAAAPGPGRPFSAWSFLCGATQFNEPGVFMSFEESAEELTKNVASLGFDLNRLTASKRLLVDYVHIERSEIEETGEYDLEGLFIRLGNAIDSIGAKRVVLDTIESLFAGLPNPSILRAELRRLFRWLKKKGMTAIITGERGDNALTRHGLEEYVSDCVILLDHRVANQISTRRLRIVKYRGSTHGTNEFPFLIDERGIVRHAHYLSWIEAYGHKPTNFDRHPSPRQHAGRKGIFPWQQYSCIRNRRDRQDQHCGALCRCSVPPWGAIRLFCL